MQVLTIFVAIALTSSYDEKKIEITYMDLKSSYREDHTSTRSSLAIQTLGLAS